MNVINSPLRQSGTVASYCHSAIVVVLNYNSTKVGVGTVPIPLFIAERRVSIKAHEIANRVPIPFVLKKLSFVELILSKIVELLAQFAIKSARI